jgi:hypothetical protein
MHIPGSESGTGDEKLLDFAARCPGDTDKSVLVLVGVDLTVIATMAAKYLTPALAGSRARNRKPSPRSLPRSNFQLKPRQVRTASMTGPSRR